MWYVLGIFAFVLFVLHAALPATILGNLSMIACAFFLVTIVMSAMHPGDTKKK